MSLVPRYQRTETTDSFNPAAYDKNAVKTPMRLDGMDSAFIWQRDCLFVHSRKGTIQFAVITILALLLLGFVLGVASTLAVLLFAAVIIEDDEKQKRATRSAVAVTVRHGINESSKTGIIVSSSPDDVPYH